MRNYLSLVACSLSLIACAGEQEGTTELYGTVTYRDSSTDHDGRDVEPASPPAQSARLTMVVEGTGVLPALEPDCALDPAGQFQARYLGTLAVGADRAHSASLLASETAITTPSGCTVPDLTVDVVTDVVIRAELEATTQNCETYCAATARAEAEQSCGATSSSAACRSSAEAQASASCAQTCTTQAHRIAAEVSLAAALLGSVDADALHAAAFGSLAVDLQFDHMIDGDGNRL